MAFVFRKGLIISACLAAFSVMPVWAAPALTPMPAQMTLEEGAFSLSDATKIHVPAGDAELMSVATWLRDTLKTTRGLTLEISEAAPAESEKAIRLNRIQTLVAEDNEAYHLSVSNEGVTIGAVNRAGAFYGAVTLWQLATPDAAKGAVDLPAVSIFDTPRFKWRGLMIDSVRHFQSVEEIKRIIDGMASQKLNVLQWHLTDDQGWRLEIRAYPDLTAKTAYRQEAGAAGVDGHGKPLMYGGFYTQDQARDIVAYAAARNITVVPEIDVPGHATAAITAYPELGTEGTPPKQGLSDWGVYPNLYNVKDSTFTFIDTVLDEVMDIFPSEYIHVGGDEAIKPQWEASPEIQAKMKALGLKNEMELQSWFIGRVGQHLAEKGRRLIGWDEILEGGIAPDATVMSWRGIDGAVAAAKLGHDTVLSPAPMLYLNHRLSGSPDEPPGRGQIITLKNAYEFNPAPDEIAPEARKHILGLQGNIWTEHARTDERVERQVFPRMVAFAEIGWSAPDVRSWQGFTGRLPADLNRLTALGIRYDQAPFDAQLSLAPAGAARVTVTLSKDLELGEVHYATGGDAPTAKSPVYTEPLNLPLGTKLTTQTFLNGQPLGQVKSYLLTRPLLETRVSQQLETCAGKLVLNLEDDSTDFKGDRAVILMDILNPCWIWRKADTSKGFEIIVHIADFPFNFQLGNHPDPVKVDTPTTLEGEFNIHLDTCEGPLVAALPIGKAIRHGGLVELRGQVPAVAGLHDLCLTFTQKAPPVQWALKDIRLSPK
ncbi:beta-N-acetylhexosaminidase [Asticcacaulis taihuensis]|uniref:beta-N-acetylhexosaminidase n=1 Tax=Asticcacaulis taihuensis TaxID=260084 RepID=UPI0026EF702F|nr:family 20 glycosylhydrolase [Asticcacaulis taihuensis]